MTPQEILNRAEALGALSPEAVRNIVIVGAVMVTLLIAFTIYLIARANGREKEGETDAVKTLLENQNRLISRMYEREDKAEKLNAESVANTTRFTNAIQEQLMSLVNSTLRISESLGTMKGMSDRVDTSNSKLDEIRTMLQAQTETNRAIFEAQQRVEEMQRRHAQIQTDILTRLIELETEIRTSKPTTVENVEKVTINA